MGKNTFALLLSFLFCIVLFTGCQGYNSTEPTTETTLPPAQINADTYQWEILEDRALLSGIGNMKEQNIRIPAKIRLVEQNGTYVEEPVYGREYAVVVKSDAFAQCLSIKTVTFEDGVTVQDNRMSAKYVGMFKDCTNLTAVYNIPDSVQSMAYAFFGCKALKEVDSIPNSVTDMDSCFRGCLSLKTSPAIPESVTVMKECFRDCSSLKSVGAIHAVAMDFTRTFFGCVALEAIPELPDTVMNLNQCFFGCVSVKHIGKLPAQVQILYETFAQCSNLQIIEHPLPDTVTDLCGTFDSCSSLQSFPGNIPPNATNLNRMFYGCESLISLEGILPETVTSLERTFEGCVSLKEIPVMTNDHLLNMWFGIAGCNALKEIRIDNCDHIILGHESEWIEDRPLDIVFGRETPDIVYLQSHKPEGICEGCQTVYGTFEVDGVILFFWETTYDVYADFVEYFKNEVPQELKACTARVNIITDKHWAESYRPSENHTREEYLTKLSGIAFSENGEGHVNILMCNDWDTENSTLIHELSHNYDWKINPSGVRASQTEEWKKIHEKEGAVLAERFYRPEMYGRYSAYQKRVESYAMATAAYFHDVDFLKQNCMQMYMYLNAIWGKY